MPDVHLLRADAGRLPLRDGSVHLCVTSPPYLWQRVYNAPLQVFGGDPACAHEWRWYWDDQNPHGDDGTDAGLDGGTATQAQTRHGKVRQAFCQHCGAWLGQLGLEPTADAYIAHLVGIFREVWRVLADEGQCFVVIDDKRTSDRQWSMVPERFALAMQADGWRVEDKVVWHKKACMPGSQLNRFTHDFENVWMFNKSREAFFDMDAVREPLADFTLQYLERPWRGGNGKLSDMRQDAETMRGEQPRANSINPAGRSRRAVWSLSSAGTSYAHYAPFPPQLVDIMVRACSSERGACPACGRQWRRVVERGDIVYSDAGQRKRADAPGAVLFPVSVFRTGEIRARNSLGFAPACACDLPPVPSVVLDPFGGTGTTAVVAQRLGRRAVCCDLSEPYLHMARERTGLADWDRWHGGNGKAAEADLSELPLFAGGEA